jgi:hypothetical protein
LVKPPRCSIDLRTRRRVGIHHEFRGIGARDDGAGLGPSKGSVNPSTAFGVTQTRSRGTFPMIMVQADRNLPLMMTRSPESGVELAAG